MEKKCPIMIRIKTISKKMGSESGALLMASTMGIFILLSLFAFYLSRMVILESRNSGFHALDIKTRNLALSGLEHGMQLTKTSYSSLVPPSAVSGNFNTGAYTVQVDKNNDETGSSLPYSHYHLLKSTGTIGDVKRYVRILISSYPDAFNPGSFDGNNNTTNAIFPTFDDTYFQNLLGQIPENGPSGHVVINEVYTGAPDYIELYNYGTSINLNGWQWYWHDNRGYSNTYILPNITLNAGSFLKIKEMNGSNTNTVIYMGHNMMWTASSSNGIAGELRNNNNSVIDFFRTAGDNTNPTGGTGWGSPNIPYPVTNDVARRISDNDTNTGSDWAVGGSITDNALNPGQSGGGSSNDLINGSRSLSSYNNNKYIFSGNVIFNNATVTGPGKIMVGGNLTFENTTTLTGNIEIICGGTITVTGGSRLGTNASQLDQSVIMYSESGLVINNGTIYGLTINKESTISVTNTSAVNGGVINFSSGISINQSQVTGSVVALAALTVSNSTLSKGSLPPIFGKDYGFNPMVIPGSYLEY